MRLFTWSFPQTAPIVVSRILKVFGSSEHKPGSKNFQNKQGTGGGVSVGSPMLKLVREIESIQKCQSCRHIFSHTFLLTLPLLFMKKDDDPLFMESG